jgi:hypothetical protein
VNIEDLEIVQKRATKLEKKIKIFNISEVVEEVEASYY